MSRAHQFVGLLAAGTAQLLVRPGTSFNHTHQCHIISHEVNVHARSDDTHDHKDTQPHHELFCTHIISTPCHSTSQRSTSLHSTAQRRTPCHSIPLHFPASHNTAQHRRRLSSVEFARRCRTVECLFKSAERSIGRLDELGVAGACVTCGAMSQVASASITSSVCFDGRPHCGAMAFTNLRSTNVADSYDYSCGSDGYSCTVRRLVLSTPPCKPHCAKACPAHTPRAAEP